MIGTKLYKPIQDTFIDVEKVVTDTFTETIQVPDETSETGFRDEEVTRTEERIEYERVKNDAPNTREAYAIMAGWCNSNNARIVDKGDYFEVEAIPAPTAEEQAEIDMNEAKQVRAEAVSRIVVEVDGIQFDGDETSQDRMARAVANARAEADIVNAQRKAVWLEEWEYLKAGDESADPPPEPEYDNYLDYVVDVWVTADNKVHFNEITISQLARAGKLAGQIQSSLWFKPYKEVSDGATDE